MDRFIRELEIGEIYQRDKWQFELKSEFIPTEEPGKNVYIQEFYFFIPNSLHINEETYPKPQFYQDHTNLIRYKTPEFELAELSNKTNKKSPLNVLENYSQTEPSKKNITIVEDELKLLANIMRSSTRESVRNIIEKIDKPSSAEQEQDIFRIIRILCEQLHVFRERYLSIQSHFMKKWNSMQLQNLFLYIDEFLSETIDYYLIGLLSHLQRSDIANKKAIAEYVSTTLLEEQDHREKILRNPSLSENDTEKNEHILYTRGLLNKFVVDALLLITTRSSVIKRFENLIGSLAAAIAMLFFFVLFTKQSSVLIINSMSFILLTVLLYVLKDRIKEGLKNLSYQQFAKWFSDYKTEIHSPDGTKIVGKMREYVSFIENKKLPHDIKQIRNKEFHTVLETFERPEHILYYKKVIKMQVDKKFHHARRKALNILFRFTVSKFLKKADNPIHEYTTMDPNTLELYKTSIPKVYHLNVIIKNTFFTKEGDRRTELKKFRLILDKNGIKRVEHISH